MVKDKVRYSRVRKQILSLPKSEDHQKPLRALQPFKILERKWKSISMDLIMGLPRRLAWYDAIWVTVDKLTKSAHFLPFQENYPLEKLAHLYIQEIVRLHGVPSTITSNKDPRFTSRFWGLFQRAFDIKLCLSTTYHPQIDGQKEITIQTLEDMLKVCMMEQRGCWNRYLPLVEFAYNNSYHASIGMVLYEALYGRKWKSPFMLVWIGRSKTFGAWTG